MATNATAHLLSCWVLKLKFECVAAQRLDMVGRMPALTDLSAIELSDAIQTGSASCVEVMTAFLERIDAVNADLNALINLTDPDCCLDLARQSDAQLRCRELPGLVARFPDSHQGFVQRSGISHHQRLRAV